MRSKPELEPPAHRTVNVSLPEFSIDFSVETTYCPAVHERKKRSPKELFSEDNGCATDWSGPMDHLKQVRRGVVWNDPKYIYIKYIILRHNDLPKYLEEMGLQAAEQASRERS